MSLTQLVSVAVVFLFIAGAFEMEWNELTRRSSLLTVQLPTNDNRLLAIFARSGHDERVKEELVNDAKETRVIVHKQTVALMEEFLKLKQQHGSQIERDLYRAMSVDEFIKRLVEKRPLVFMGSDDVTVLRDGSYFPRASAKWDNVGTDREEAPFVLSYYLSYDEMQLSALIGVSSPTRFINTGSRNNRGHASSDSFIQRGIYIGLVGARFERMQRMEAEYILQRDGALNILQTKPNPKVPDTLRLLKSFFHYPYGEQLVTLRNGLLFDQAAYKARMRITIELLLAEANTRGEAVGRKTFIHFVGFGLGITLF